MKTTTIGLDKEQSMILITALNELLSDFQIYYQNLRGLHWNIKGRNFFELHLKFEELYNDAQLKIDLVAERILTLEGQPLHTLNDYMNHSKIGSVKNISNDEKALQLIVESMGILLEIERKILEISANAQDEGTNSMMSDFITEQEKTVWMLKAWLA